MDYFYIDVPGNYMRKETVWLSTNVWDHMRIVSGAQSVKFMFNCLSRVSTGDVYKITLNNDCIEFYILRNGFKIINSSVVENYILSKQLSFNKSKVISF